LFASIHPSIPSIHDVRFLPYSHLPHLCLFFFFFANREEEWPIKDGHPGPGSYEATLSRRRSPAYSFGIKLPAAHRVSTDAAGVPAPNSYDVKQYRINYNEAPKSTLKSRKGSKLGKRAYFFYFFFF
jgi:hypothetical protein